MKASSTSCHIQIKGFTLAEILLVSTLLSIFIAYGFSSYSKMKINTQTRLELYQVLQISSLMEQYFSENLYYPEQLSEIITPKNGIHSTANGYYHLSYKPGPNNRYTITARVNPQIRGAAQIKCFTATVDHAGNLSAFDRHNNDISFQCWKK